MAFGSFNGKRGATPMSDINVIPLVDIMLVLLVIFIITAPLLTHAIKIDLPKTAGTPNVAQEASVQFAIDGGGRMYWDGEPVTREQMLARFAQAAQRSPVPELHLRVDKGARYEVLADVMSEAGRAGLTRIGFVTDPSGRLHECCSRSALRQREHQQ
ncbi:MAG TPA: biopolymer transporter ExbD [Steroidobacteraceae bacterium]|nr:biopolymer transporter ExbD [Steroidobacteraceae bacterium]